jgi:hypothetical protein
MHVMDGRDGSLVSVPLAVLGWDTCGGENFSSGWPSVATGQAEERGGETHVTDKKEKGGGLCAAPVRALTHSGANPIALRPSLRPRIDFYRPLYFSR